VALGHLGVVPVIVDVFDATEFEKVMIAARPDVVIHQDTVEKLFRGLLAVADRGQLEIRFLRQRLVGY
jgi:hypothetical protein